jgi:anti-sigma B factor antagonist
MVTLSGEIDIVTAHAARVLLAGAVSEAVTGVTVDLGAVTFVDAAGLGAPAAASSAARHLPGGFRLAAVPSRVLRLLALSGLDRHLAAFPAPPCGRPQRAHADTQVSDPGAGRDSEATGTAAPGRHSPKEPAPSRGRRPESAERSRCSTARPAAVVVMPPAAERPYPVDFLLCAHHYQPLGPAQLAAGAITARPGSIPRCWSVPGNGRRSGINGWRG